jgi:hypothetical protein
MTIYRENARSIINAFLWSEIKESGVLDEDDYRPDNFTKSLVPIIPAQEVPEFNNLLQDKTYIIYDYEINDYMDKWWICEESMSYSIVGTKFGKVMEIIELMVDLFRRKDLSGKDLQSFNTNQEKIKFYSACLDYVSSPSPAESEGGRIVGVVQITYKYSREVNSNGRFT